MKFHELNTVSKTSKRRVGRGIAAGQGKTAGRGTKGQKSRAGSSRKPGFEGGQNPLIQRLPKLRGFNSHRPNVEVVYTSQLNSLGAKVDNKILADAGLITNAHVLVKLIVDGDVEKKVDVKLQRASASAVKALAKKGGSFTKVAQVGREPKNKDTSAQN